MDDQTAAISLSTARRDLERLVMEGTTLVALEGCRGLARMVFDHLGIQEPISSGGHATFLQEVLKNVIDEHMQHAIKRLRELPLRNAGHDPSFQVAAAGELLRITNQELFDEVISRRKPMISETWSELRNKPHNQGVAEEFQLRAAIWVGAKSARTGERRQDKFLDALESAIKVYIAKRHKGLRVLVSESAVSGSAKDSDATTSAAPGEPPNPISVVSQTAQTQEALAEEHVGKPISDYAVNPLLLGIHPAIDLGPDTAGLDKLPLYVRRLHDDKLAEYVKRATAGESVIATLVGDSSTGKTRACWEAVRYLDDEWRLWHPISPSEPEALLESIARIGPRTVLWLNEIQRYLEAPLLV